MFADLRRAYRPFVRRGTPHAPGVAFDATPKQPLSVVGRDTPLLGPLRAGGCGQEGFGGVLEAFELAEFLVLVFDVDGHIGVDAFDRGEKGGPERHVVATADCDEVPRGVLGYRVASRARDGVPRVPVICSWTGSAPLYTVRVRQIRAQVHYPTARNCPTPPVQLQITGSTYTRSGLPQRDGVPISTCFAVASTTIRPMAAVDSGAPADHGLSRASGSRG